MEDSLSPDASLFSQPTEVIDPLHLDMPDEDFAHTLKDHVKKWDKWATENKLRERQEKNLQYFLAQQPGKKYSENLIWEAINRIKPIALSRMPDITVKAGNDSLESKETSEKLSGVLNSDIKKRENRRLYGLAHKLEPLYFFAVTKARWNPEKGKHGDYEFVNVHPDNVVFDYACTTTDANDMRLIAEKAPMMLKELIMAFPDKEAEIKASFGWLGDERDKEEEDKLASMVNVWEVWFHWYKEVKSEGRPAKYERIDGTAWMYKDVVLKKMKNPYFDFQGKKKIISRVLEEKNAFSVDEIFQMLDVEQGRFEEETVYSNYFEQPEKPYFFWVSENLGKHPIDATSRVEQVLEFQDAQNESGAQILDMNKRSRGKDLFDTNAIPQTTLDQIDLYNVDQAVGIDVPQGKSINDAHARIEQQPATPQMYRSMQENRQKAFEMMGVGATTRGIQEPDSTLGESQMAREADYGVIDDLVEDTINACAEWQARWAMQFIKLFYNKPHFRHILGKDGEVLHTKLSQDMVEDGMEAVISASGVDKMMRKRQAMENMKLGIGDPLSYYEDTEQSNPKERAKRAMMAQMAPQMYIQTYLMDSMEQPGEQNPLLQQALAVSQGVPGSSVSSQPPTPPPGAPMGGGNPYASSDPLGLFS